MRALRKPYTLAWLAIFTAGAILELVALLDDREQGDTLSEHVWAILQRSSLLWFLGLGMFAWAAYHFFFERPQVRPKWKTNRNPSA